MECFSNQKSSEESPINTGASDAGTGSTNPVPNYEGYN